MIENPKQGIGLFKIIILSVTCFIIISIIGVVVITYPLYRGINNAREVKTIMQTPSDKLSPEQLVIKKTKLDEDIDSVMAYGNFDIFDQYFKVNRAEDGHRTYSGLCASYRAESLIKRLTDDSPENPVCRDTDLNAIIYVVNNKSEVVCIDVKNKQPITLAKKPTGLSCN